MRQRSLPLELQFFQCQTYVFASVGSRDQIAPEHTTNSEYQNPEQCRDCHKGTMWQVRSNVENPAAHDKGRPAHCTNHWLAAGAHTDRPHCPYVSVTHATAHKGEHDVSFF
jgi:hypothetical protein